MQFAAIRVARAKPMVSVSRVSVEDRLGEISHRITESEHKQLTPQEFTFLLKHVDRLPDELVSEFQAALRTKGLPDERQTSLLQLDPSWVEHLPDVCASAQRWLLNRGRNLQELVEKIPTLVTVSPQLLRYAVNSNWATPEIIKFLLTEYGKELSGMGLRKTALLHSPEVLKNLPSGIDLSSDEMKALIKVDPDNYRYFSNPDPSIRQAYRDYLRAERKSGDESAIAELGEKPVLDLIDELREAEARGMMAKADAIRAKIKALQEELGSHLTADMEASESDDDSEEEEQPKEGRAMVDRTDLTGAVLQGGTHRYLVLQDLPIMGEVPQFAKPFLRGLTPSRIYRLLDLSSRTVVLLVPDSTWAKNVQIVGKYSPALFTTTVDRIRSEDAWKPVKALGPNFKNLSDSQLESTSEDDVDTEQEDQKQALRQTIKDGKVNGGNDDEEGAEADGFDDEDADVDSTGEYASYSDEDLDYEADDGDIEGSAEDTAQTAIDNLKKMHRVMKQVDKMTKQLAGMGNQGGERATTD